MNPSNYPIAAISGNDTSEELSLHLERLAEEVILVPGHRVELLARPSSGSLPICVLQVDRGLQVQLVLSDRS